MANVAAIPAGERPVLDELGVYDDFDEDVEQGNDLKLLELVVADLAQLLVKSLGISDLQQVLPHGVEFVVSQTCAPAHPVLNTTSCASTAFLEGGMAQR